MSVECYHNHLHNIQEIQDIHIKLAFTNMDSFTRCVVNLKVLSNIQDYERLRIDEGVFSIQPVSRSRITWLWTILSRSLSTQSRDTTLRHIHYLVSDCERIRGKLMQHIPDAIRGIDSLKRTYAADITTTASLDLLSIRLNNILN